ncbi:MAG TPA: invasion associated locus B family protein [Rhizomicrobium sp.]|nr:invasion associated locus B family protein [Rhizomicrobium sp.]
MTGFARSVLVAAVASLAASPALAAPTLIGTYKDWSAFQSVTNTAKVCYVLAKPSSSEPKKAKRDPIYFMISDWPLRKAKGEVQVVPGYQYKDGSPVTVQIGADKFDLFTQNGGGAGSAWVEEVASERRLVEAMKGGAKAVVSGVSQRGTTTKDTYGLAGLSEALDKVHEACGM